MRFTAASKRSFVIVCFSESEHNLSLNLYGIPSNILKSRSSFLCLFNDFSCKSLVANGTHIDLSCLFNFYTYAYTSGEIFAFSQPGKGCFLNSLFDKYCLFSCSSYSVLKSYLNES
jgi:hypothetical protein